MVDVVRSLVSGYLAMFTAWSADGSVSGVVHHSFSLWSYVLYVPTHPYVQLVHTNDGGLGWCTVES